MVSQNLQYLRKRDKITQEELADRLGVSRQAVSKWETGEAYPETEKLILLCDHFGVSIDAFVRSDLSATEDEKPVPLPARRKAANAFICAITLGVFLILLGVAACVAVNGYALCFEGQKSDRIAGMGVSVLLAFVAVAVFLFVFFGIKHDSLSDRCGGKIDCDYVAAEKKKFIKKYAAAIACFVFAILADVLALVTVSVQIDSGNLFARNADAAYCYATAVFIGVLAFAVSGLTACGMTHEKYFGKAEKRRGKNKIADAICGAIMLLCTAVFLLLGFCFALWHPGWAVFPVGGILCAVVNTVCGALSDKNAKNNDQSSEE